MDSTAVAALAKTATTLGMSAKQAFFWWLLRQFSGDLLVFIAVMVIVSLAYRLIRTLSLIGEIEELTGRSMDYPGNRKIVKDCIAKHVPPRD